MHFSFHTKETWYVFLVFKLDSLNSYHCHIADILLRSISYCEQILEHHKYSINAMQFVKIKVYTMYDIEAITVKSTWDIQGKRMHSLCYNLCHVLWDASVIRCNYTLHSFPRLAKPKFKQWIIMKQSWIAYMTPEKITMNYMHQSENWGDKFSFVSVPIWTIQTIIGSTRW